MLPISVTKKARYANQAIGTWTYMIRCASPLEPIGGDSEECHRDDRGDERGRRDPTRAPDPAQRDPPGARVADARVPHAGVAHSGAATIS